MGRDNGGSNGNWRTFLTVCIAAAGAGGIGGVGTNALLSAQLDRIDAERVRNLQSIAKNTHLLSEHGERLRALEQCIQYVQRDLARMDTKLDQMLRAVE